jgi:hypothetical protein
MVQAGLALNDEGVTKPEMIKKKHWAASFVI